MIPQSLVARIRGAFPDSLCQAFVAALDEAYQEVSSFHRPERGWNNFTFGTGVWTIALFQLQELARDAEWELVEEVDNHRVTFLKDGLHLSCYKVGFSAEEDIFSSFPNNQNAAKRLVQNNRQYDLFGESYQEGAPVDLVLAHLGNPARGLEAVYLCVPSAVGTDDRICDWAYAQLLWRRDARAVVGAAEGELAAEVAIERPVIRLKLPHAVDHG
jgi:hypothetical protein